MAAICDGLIVVALVNDFKDTSYVGEVEIVSSLTRIPELLSCFSVRLKYVPRHRSRH